MASSISWLDSSSVEQRRMREILGLFTDKESREELGLGQLRDALSDALFPGTSTLHTRAKYLLFIPWVFQQVSKQGGTLAQTRSREAALIQTLKKSGVQDLGIIGAEAGSTLKTMPSSLYWSALGTYGILTNPHLSREQAISIEGAQLAQGDLDHSATILRAWRPEMPAAPEGFPHEAPGGMALTVEESTWLRERLLTTAPNTLLAHLVTQTLDKDSGAPWEDPAANTVTGAAQHTLAHARYFSETMHGAQLLYNVLIAESYEEHNLTRIVGKRDEFAGRLAEWASRYEAEKHDRDWDLDRFFALLTRTRGSQVGRSTENFVRSWAALLKTVDTRTLLTHAPARELVTARERQNKGAMARINNLPRLETWGGSSGAGRYIYRWTYVRRILIDIQDGLFNV